MRMRQVLDAWIDGELDRATAAEIEQHIAACPACLALKAERDALRLKVRDAAQYYATPAAFKAALHARLAARTPVRATRTPGWLQAGVFASFTAAIGLLAGLWIARPPSEDPLREQIVASHVASLSDTQRLITVASSDQHTVKPWLQGKIDFAPAVRDLSMQGYTLLGARLDHVADRQATAIVYRMRNHVINLYAWRATGYNAEALTLQSARGFGLATWADGGLRYAAVSDIERGDLERFARLAQAP